MKENIDKKNLNSEHQMKFPRKKSMQDRIFLIFFLITLIGFLFLFLLGDKINSNPFHPFSFLAPIALLIGYGGMIGTLISKGKTFKN